MASGFDIIVFILFAISAPCFVFTALLLLTHKGNSLILINCMGGTIMCLGCLYSLVFDINAETIRATLTNYTLPPSTPCFIQAIIIQYSACLVIISASCFAHQTYRLLVRCSVNELYNTRMMKWYYLLIFAYPTIMVIPLAILSKKKNAIQPRGIICDVDNPPWLRMMGYAGCNLIMCIPGVYFSARAALAVVQHLDKFKSASTLSGLTDFTMLEPLTYHDETIQYPKPCLHRASFNQKSEYQEIMFESGTTTFIGGDTLKRYSSFPSESKASFNKYFKSLTNLVKQDESDQIKLHITSKSYNLTKVAAIRMTAFSILFLTINIASSIKTFAVVINHEQLSHDLGGSDVGGGCLGIIMLLIFGTGSEAKKFISSITRLLRKRFRCS